MQNKITKIFMNIAIVFITAYFIYCLIDPYKPRGMLNEQLVIWCLVLAVLVVMIIKIADSNKPNRKTAIQGLEEFKYPAVNKRLMSIKPTGIIFGKYKHRYVCKKSDEDGHVIILGGSGSGKSSTVIIPMLLSNKDVGSFCIDIKGELSYKASDYTDSNTVIFNPLNRFSYGYDVFYALNDNSSSQELYEVIQNVVYSLISISASEKNPFWKNSARALLMGLMINYYKKGAKNFIDIIDLILSKPIKEQVEDIINEGNKKSNEYKLLIQFKDLAEDTLSGIVVELVNSINLFSTDNDIRYSFRDNVKKFNPLMIEEQKHIFIVIEEHKLMAYFVVNGDTGIVVDKGIDEKGKGYLLIKFYADTERETDKKIHFDDIDRYVLDHADCITVHKSQGSQYEDVTVIIPDNTKASISINLFYTAISRAKNKVRIFVNKEKLLEILKSCPEDRRTIVRLLNRKISQ